METLKKQRPVLLSLHRRIDDLFAKRVGPISGLLCDQELTALLAKDRMGPAAVHSYIGRLAQHIEQQEIRRAFVEEAYFSVGFKH